MESSGTERDGPAHSELIDRGADTFSPFGMAEAPVNFGQGMIIIIIVASRYDDENCS